MFFIYCYTNLINGHCYVGQTSNMERRNKEHMSRAFSQNHNESNNVFHRKLREYGKENFKLEILEVITNADQDVIDEREIYWIKEKRSFIQDNGYNMTRGGRRNCKYNPKEGQSDELILELLRDSDLSLQDIAKVLDMGHSTIKKINSGKLRSYLSDDYPIRKKSLYQQRADKVKDLLMYSTLSAAEIMTEVGVSEETVRRINRGETHHDESLVYPLR